MKRFLSLLLMLSFLFTAGASACTAVYVGPEASADGTLIIAKSNDYQDVWPNYVTIVERVENEPGRTMPVDVGRTVFVEIPATTYRYTATPWMDSAQAMNGLTQDATICSNEYGVSMIMSITAFTNDRALSADPLIDTGLTEFSAVDLVICQSRTAREGVDVLCGILDTFGSSECNIAFIADQRETWYIEMYTGHQYAAVKLPRDKVCVFGNEFTMEYLSEYGESVTSPALFSLAEENGFAVYNENGEMNLYATYSGDGIRTGYSHMRTWIGHQVLAPSVYGGDYDAEAFYPLCFEADGKVSLQDVMELIRNRFENTPYSPDETGRGDMRVIGTDTALSVHILQEYSDLPAEMACVTWESAAPALYGVFVPVSNGSLRVSDVYSRNQPAEEAGQFDTRTYPWYAFKALNTLCVEKDACAIYGAPVRAFWREAESNMIAAMAETLREASAANDLEKVTAYCVMAQEQAFTDAKTLLNDVIFAMSKNSNTMKNGRNPETHEILDEKKAVPPMEVSIAADRYSERQELGGRR